MSKSVFRHSALVVALCGLLTGVSLAETQSPEEIIAERLQQARPDMSFGAVRPSAFEGLYQVQISGGPTLYVSADGSKFIAGDVFEITDTGFVQMQDPYLLQERKELVASIDPEKTINFPAKGETKAVVYVFTDVDCGFCRRLHQQIESYRDGVRSKPGYSDLGIEIRYLAYPRAGVDSPSGEKLITAWCSEDQHKAMDDLKNLRRVSSVQCDDHPVAEQMELGGKFGVSGTPALLFTDGRMMAGYMPPEDLAKQLGL